MGTDKREAQKDRRMNGNMQRQEGNSRKFQRSGMRMASRIIWVNLCQNSKTWGETESEETTYSTGTTHLQMFWPRIVSVQKKKCRENLYQSMKERKSSDQSNIWSIPCASSKPCHCYWCHVVLYRHRHLEPTIGMWSGIPTEVLAERLKDLKDVLTP